jgi:hypothetical protein
MAVRTSTQSGNLATGSTWVGGVAPGTSDSIILSDGHTVTVAANATIGQQPASGGFAVDGAGGSGSLVIAAGVTFIVKGGLRTHSGGITLNAGAILDVRPSTTQDYTISIATYANPTGYLICNGTSGAHCKIYNSTAHGSVAIGTYTYDGSPDLECHYTDFENLGTADAINAFTTGAGVIYDHCTFLNCGTIQSNSFDDGSSFAMEYCHIETSKSYWPLWLDFQTALTGGATRTVKYNSFTDAQMLFFEMRSVTVQGNYFEFVPYDASSSYPPDHEDDFFNSSELNLQSASIKNCYSFDGGDNLHGFLLSLAKSQTFDGNILEQTEDWVSDGGDGFLLVGVCTASNTYSIINNIVLKAVTKPGYTLFTVAVDADAVFTVRNNTFCAGTYGGSFLAAHYNGVAGMVAAFQDNLGWSVAADTAGELIQFLNDEGVADDYVTAADHNGRWYVTTPYKGDAAWYASTPGTGDLNEDPAFVDNTRCLSAWAEEVLGHTGTKAELETEALAALSEMNYTTGAHYHEGISISSLCLWVKGGFAPTNMNYADAGYAGGYIGAVEPVAPAAASDVPMLLMVPF